MGATSKPDQATRVPALADLPMWARLEITDLRAENERLRAILDGTDDAAIERAAEALREVNHGVVPVARYRGLALAALRAAGDRSVETDETDGTP